jgi:hypothetical protein
MVGRRLSDGEWLNNILPADSDLDDLRDGDYWKVNAYTGGRRPDGFGDDPNVCWCVYYHGAAMIPLHHVEEHDNGTITVEPGPWGSNSIQIGDCFHGYIRRGVWEPC